MKDMINLSTEKGVNMEREDFELSVTVSGIKQYLHIENGEKRKKLLKDRMEGTISSEEFMCEQKKMRGGKYLKYIYSESEMEEAIRKDTHR
jgi:hypothetical protein